MDFGDPLIFPVAPSSGQHFNASSISIYDQIPAELMTFPSVSAVLIVYIAN